MCFRRLHHGHPQPHLGLHKGEYQQKLISAKRHGRDKVLRLLLRINTIFLYHIAQYGQWDGYPTGQGVVVLDFVKDPANLAKLKVALDTPGRLYEPTEAQLTLWSQKERERDQEVYRKRAEDPSNWIRAARASHASVHRDTSARILHLVVDATEPVPIVKEIKFIADTLFCERAYVVDLDTEIWPPPRHPRVTAIYR
ncbi:hypothetical protein LTR17_021939 [Elasticomyces elasticus]|nr:hypothetical protein LTR17_021939 [Elasticomyces elasticus]